LEKYRFLTAKPNGQIFGFGLPKVQKNNKFDFRKNQAKTVLIQKLPSGFYF
jgi:hypothetical protein